MTAKAFQLDEEILRPLTQDEVHELFILYKEQYGVRNFHYLLMYNQLSWNRKLKEINAYEDEKWIAFRKTFYTHRLGDFRKHGTYISLHYDIMQSVSFHSWEPGFNELFECLDKTKLIDWKSGPLITNVDLHLCEPFKQLALQKGCTIQRARTCPGLTMLHEKALDLILPDIPKGYLLRELHEDNAEMIHSLWPNRKEGSAQYIKGLIQINKTLGLYREIDNELVAWIFQNDFCGLGILQVSPSVQRMGFGSLLGTYLSKKIAETEDVTLSAWIVVENFKSEALLKKIGYEITILNEWIQLNTQND